MNSNLQILKYNELINENDSIFNITNNEIITNNINISNNIVNTFSINHNDENILLIDCDSCNLDIMNYDFNYYINSNSFNIYDTINDNTTTSNNVIFGVESNKININCDLIVGKIITKNIDSIDGKGINITSYQIEQNNFQKVSVGLIIILHLIYIQMKN